MDKFELFVDIEKFSRKLNIKKFFIENKFKERIEESSSFSHDGLKKKSTFNPKSTTYKHIEVFKKYGTGGCKVAKSCKK